MNRLPLVMLVLITGGSCAPNQPPKPRPAIVERYIIPISIPNHWQFCMESPQANGQVPGEPNLLGPTVCLGTVGELRHRLSHILRASTSDRSPAPSGN